MRFFRGRGITFKSYSVNSLAGASGTYFYGGFYTVNAGEKAFTQAATTQTEGASNVPYGAHAFLVCKEVGAASGGSGAVTMVVSGTSITDAGVRTGSDTETIISDITGSDVIADAYFETAKKWIGQITYTLTVGATGHTAYNLSANYGLVKYDDFGNRPFTVTDWEIEGTAGANDASFECALLHHNASDFTYSAAAFDPASSSAIVTFTTDYDTENDLDSGVPFAWKRTGLSTKVDGAGSEGIVICITTGANNAVENASAHVGVKGL